MTPRARVIASLVTILLLLVFSALSLSAPSGRVVAGVCAVLALWNAWMAWRAWREMQ